MSDEIESVEVQTALDEIQNSLEDLKQTVIIKNKNQNIWLKKMEHGLKIIKWSKEKYRMQFIAPPQYVFQRDIFYCHLGVNIGQEEYWDRPVVVLQNDLGNKSSTTTIIAPITTCEGSTLKELNGEWFLDSLELDGTTKSRKLYYFEICVELEPNFKKEIKGIINLAQIRVISKKRLISPDVAKITVGTKNKINQSLKRLLNIC